MGTDTLLNTVTMNKVGLLVVWLCRWSWVCVWLNLNQSQVRAKASTTAPTDPSTDPDLSTVPSTTSPSQRATSPRATNLRAMEEACMSHVLSISHLTALVMVTGS